LLPTPSGIGTAGAGAELTQEQVARILIAPLQARSVVLAAGPRISNELVRHSVLAIATVIGQAIVERTALEIDAAMLTGTGTSNTITGFTPWPAPPA
jgi:HK97 family phage major capsid protein